MSTLPDTSCKPPAPSSRRRVTVPVSPAVVFGAVAAILLAVLTVAVPDAHAEGPCADLSEEELGKFQEVAAAAAEAYGAEDYAQAIALSHDALDICYGHPAVLYNLARSHQKAGDCNMALFTFEEIPLDDVGEGLREKIEGYKAELMPTCGDNPVVLIACDDPEGVELQVGDRTTDCPWSGRVNPGNLSVTATREGYMPWEDQFEVTADEPQQTFEIPALKSEDQFGTLSVTCKEGISSFTLVYPNGDEVVQPCPYEDIVEVGNYKAFTSPEGKPIPIVVVGREVTNLDALATPPPGACSCTTVRREPRDELPAGLALLALAGLVALRRRR